MKDVHNPKDFIHFTKLCKQLKDKKTELEELTDELAVVDETAEHLEHLILCGLTRESIKSLEEYYNKQVNALYGKQIQVRYEINEIEKQLLDFEAAAWQQS